MNLFGLLAVPLLSVDEARAKAEPCSPVELLHSAPAPGAQDVPVDAALGLFFGTRGRCWLDEDVLLVRLEVAGPDAAWVVVREEDVSAGPGDLGAWIVPEGGLAADAEHRLTVSSSAWFAEIAFRTGTGTTAVVEGQPAADLLDTVYIGRDTDAVRFQVEVTAAGDPAGTSTVGLVRTDDPSAILVGRAANDLPDDGLFGHLPVAARPDEACVSAVQWDGAGRRIGDAEVLCGEPRRPGCATTGGGGPWLLALAATLSRLRRAAASGPARRASSRAGGPSRPPPRGSAAARA